jgi:hypothetical protein
MSMIANSKLKTPGNMQRFIFTFTLILVCTFLGTAQLNIPAAPDGFDTAHDGISKGKIEMISYKSKTVGVERGMPAFISLRDLQKEKTTRYFTCSTE